nr:immunoglobulin light chain junction region [Macaca mulatta]MOW39840.1 immunoglobulin light chain junction region [Macaca mulatta]
YYQYYSGYTF